MFLKKLAISLAILALITLVSVWGAVHFGSEPIPASKIDPILWNKILGKPLLETPILTIVWELRLPRVLLALLVGASLSVAGTAFQGLLRNPLADPYIVGTSAGAAVGGVFALVFNIQGGFWGMSGVTLLAFIGALISMYVIYRISLVEGKIPVETFLLAGVVVGSFLWAMVSFLLTLAHQSMHQVVFWLMGSTQSATWNGIIMLFFYFLMGTAGLIFVSHPLNLLTLGDESAQHLGVDVERTKNLTIIFASLITASAVSVSGLIGFVGLMIPHIVRMMLGADHRILIPTSALVGGIFLLWVDTFARSFFSPQEMPVGILTAILGSPFFLYLLRKRKMGL